MQSDFITATGRPSSKACRQLQSCWRQGCEGRWLQHCWQCWHTCNVVGVMLLHRWTNNHVVRVEPGSKLSHRIMQTALLMPFNHPYYQGEVMNKLCKPNGYVTVRASQHYLHSNCWQLLSLLLQKTVTHTSCAAAYTSTCTTPEAAGAASVKCYMHTSN